MTKNVVEARTWLESAARRGHAGAQYLLGIAYASGAGTDRDDWQALKWLIKAAEQGNPKAGPALARMLEKSSASMIRHCWRELAKAGSPEAQWAFARHSQLQERAELDSAANNDAAQWLERAASQGHAQAQYELGVMYADGSGVPQDFVRAREYLLAAAKQGVASAVVELGALPSADKEGVPGAAHDDLKGGRKALAANAKRFEAFALHSKAENQFHLALLYQNGVALERDSQAALKWYRASASQGYAPAHHAVGQALLESDPAEAARHFLEAAQRGHSDAQFAYATCLQQGRGVDADLFGAHAWMVRAAEQGHLEALEMLASSLQTAHPGFAWRCWERAARAGSTEGQYRLGELALSGHIDSVDGLTAADWFRLAAEGGHAEAQVRLADMYVEGLGVDPDWIEATCWYQHAIDQGLAKAQWALGNLLSRGGDGVIRDVKRAMVLCRLAAKQGYAPAQATMGNLLSQANQPARAIGWWRRAAVQGDAEALYNLGIALLNGKGVTPDPVAAFDALMRSAQQGVGTAQSRVALAYATGEGVAHDLLEAAKWWSLSASHGVAEAKENLERVRTLLSPVQWTEVERRVRMWQPMVGIA